MNRVIPTLDGRNKQTLIFTQLQCKSVLNCLSSVLNEVSILGILLIETKPFIHLRLWSERKRHKRTNMHTYLPTPSIHKAFDVHTNGTCAFIKNGKLWLVVEKSSHLLYINEKKTTSTTTSLQFDVFLFDSPEFENVGLPHADTMKYKRS